MKRFAFLALVSAGTILPGLASAQGTPGSTAPTAPAAQPAGASASAAGQPAYDGVAEARVHYERALQLFNEENYDAAAFEFQRAYELAPNYKILYNMARLQRVRNDYATALQNFQRYLIEGGTGVPDDRRAEVEKEIKALLPRVAKITVKVSETDADVYVDDGPVCTSANASCVGKSPLPGPLVVNPGRRKVTAQKRGFVTASSTVTVVGSDTITVDLHMDSLDRPQRVVDTGPRNRAIVAWGVTAALTATSAVFGVLALNESDKLKTQREVFGADTNALSNSGSKTDTYAHLCDGFAAGAIIGAGFATFFTVKALREASYKEAPERTGKVNLDLGVGYVGLHGAL
ncbi:MAG: TonB-dependent receptor [Labilithrix sp.]|nr:TonB-dependent receptor [Labilithrix sp.]